MDISDKEKSILQKLVTEDSFEIMHRIAAALLASWNQNPINRDTVWSAASDSISREERKKAITSFLKTLEELAHAKD